MSRDVWSSRYIFILSAVGSAVGLGNAWRFPGLAAKHGGGSFLLAYVLMLFIMGLPLLMMETSIGRKLRKAPPGAFRGLNKKMEFVGWAATSNAFCILCYYGIVYAWVIVMAASSFYFASMTGDPASASKLFASLTETTWKVEDYSIPTIMIPAFLAAWFSIYYCIRNGIKSMGSIVKYTVFLPIVLLLVLAVKGLMMDGATAGLAKFFIPDWSALGSSALWIDATGQVFYSLSIMMAIMVAYGSFLDDSSNLVVDCTIIALSDLAVSVLAGVVMFTTMGGVGMLDSISSSGIATAFIIYPQAIVQLTSVGWVNAIFGFVFYMVLITLAVDSAFSILEGVATSVSDKFHLNPHKTIGAIAVVAAFISIIFITRAGIAWLDIIDNYTNQFNLIGIGILECFAVAWMFDTKKVLHEINKTPGLSMPYWWFNGTVKYVAPLLLIGLLFWNTFTLITQSGGQYGGYPLWANLVGYGVMVLVFISGFIVNRLVRYLEATHNFHDEEIVWEEWPEETEAIAKEEAERESKNAVPRSTN